MQKRHLASTILASILVASISLPSFAAGPVCDFGAYLNDPDLSGTNVHSGPTHKSEVIGVLHPADADDEMFGPEFTVTAFENYWFRIGDATSGQYGDGPERVVFSGPGWVYAPLVGFEIEDTGLRSAPAADAPVVLTLIGEWSLEGVSIEQVNGCDGPFVNVTLVNAAGDRATGWATNLCGNQVTTCS